MAEVLSSAKSVSTQHTVMVVAKVVRKKIYMRKKTSTLRKISLKNLHSKSPLKNSRKKAADVATKY